jgi:hypothetical protein
MAEGNSVRLLEALLSVCEAAAVPPDAVAATLKRLLAQIAPASATKAPPALGGVAGGASLASSTYSREAATPRTVTADRTARAAPVAQPTRPDSSPANTAITGLTVAAWQKLRAQVRAAMKQRKVSLAELGAAAGYAASTNCRRG